MKKLFSLILLALIFSIGAFALVPLSGGFIGCTGSAAYVSEDSSYAGGTWSSSNTAIATVGSTGISTLGVVTGVSAGVCTITYTLGSAYVTASFTVNTSPAAITGSPLSGCPGFTATLTDATSGGVWSSTSSAVVTVGSLTGIITGVSLGSATISYTLADGCAATAAASVTTGPGPAAISGATSVCAGSAIALTDATTGGTWSSSSTGIATVSSASGVVTGVSAGTVTITYSIISTCGTAYAVHTVTVSSIFTPPAISGLTTVCVGSTITLFDTLSSGGTWSSSNTAIATVSSGGVVTGVSGGTVNITYSVTGTCGTGYTVLTITVTTTAPSPGTISGATSVAMSSSITLSETVSGGTWTSSNTAIAIVGASTGVVSGVSAGIVTITFTVIGCSSAYTTYTITVTPIDRISGYVNFSGGALDSGTLKVWLITYDPSTHLLEASDSVSFTTSTTSTYYQFLGVATDSYRVKAAYYPLTYTGTGYIPTYHTSSFYWNSANVFYHTSGTADDGEDINMAYGTVTSGAGFISGDVTLGANRGTSTTIPAVGLLMYVLNASGNVLEMTTTDASGNYSFSNLPVPGTYTIYPEALNYATTAYTGISLTTSASSMSTASFGQHSVSLTIIPITAGVKNVTSSVSSVIAFPNPTNGKLNIQWNENTTEKGSVTVTDITGRVVYTSSINMNQGTGNSQLDLSGLTNGVYLISVKSGTISYNNKIELQH